MCVCVNEVTHHILPFTHHILPFNASAHGVCVCTCVCVSVYAVTNHILPFNTNTHVVCVNAYNHIRLCVDVCIFLCANLCICIYPSTLALMLCVRVCIIKCDCRVMYVCVNEPRTIFYSSTPVHVAHACVRACVYAFMCADLVTTHILPFSTSALVVCENAYIHI